MGKVTIFGPREVVPKPVRPDVRLPQQIPVKRGMFAWLRMQAEEAVIGQAADIENAKAGYWEAVERKVNSFLGACRAASRLESFDEIAKHDADDRRAQAAQKANEAEAAEHRLAMNRIARDAELSKARLASHQDVANAA